MINSGLVPGASAVVLLMRRNLNIDLTDSQANKLWVEVRKDLLSKGKFMAVLKAQRSYFGKVEAAFEADLYESMGMVMGQGAWPVPVNGVIEASPFLANLGTYIAQHGYKIAPAPISQMAG
jgi:hypothetical protein